MSDEPRTCPTCGKGNEWVHEHTLRCPEAPTLADVAAAMLAARQCEGLQQWWGTDSDEMHRFDAALSRIQTIVDPS